MSLPVLPAFLPGIGTIGTQELIVIGVIAILLFGKRLPEVGRSLGKGFIEFKKGLQGIEHELQEATREPSRPPRRYRDVDDRQPATAPRFEPPPSEPRPVDRDAPSA